MRRPLTEMPAILTTLQQEVVSMEEALTLTIAILEKALAIIEDCMAVGQFKFMPLRGPANDYGLIIPLTGPNETSRLLYSRVDNSWGIDFVEDDRDLINQLLRQDFRMRIGLNMIGHLTIDELITIVNDVVNFIHAQLMPNGQSKAMLVKQQLVGLGQTLDQCAAAT